MVYPVIIAGGSGTRFWPLTIPKQFLSLVDSKKSLIQMAVERFDFFHKKNILVVSHKKFSSFLKKQIPHIFCLLEPEQKNTAAAIGWAAKTIFQKNPEAVMIVIPADQWVNDNALFLNDMRRAISFIEKYPLQLLTFGLKPTYPETGYGYIEAGHHHAVKKFIEKPSVEKAKVLMKSSRFFWNTGLFVWKAKTILEEIKRHLPFLYERLGKINKTNISKIYKDLPNISIDYAVLEKSKHVSMLKASFEWSDLGSWETLSSKKKSDVKQWISLDSKNCFIHAPNKRIATIGVSDLIIVETDNDLLICHRKDAQRVKEILSRID